MSLDLTLNFPQFNFAMPKPSNQKIYEFEGFRLDASHFLLYRDGQEIALTPKVVETLLVLVENEGQLLSKDELMERVWGDSIVEESNLSQNLFLLRKTLGKTADGKPFIETLRRRGYRFLPDVRIVKNGKSASNYPVEDGSARGFTRIPSGSVNGRHYSNGTSPRIEYEIPVVEPTTGERHSGSTFSSRPILIATAASILIVASLIVSGWYSINDRVSSDVNLKRLTESGDRTDAAISPDGISFAYVAEKENTFSLRLKNISTESEVEIVGPSDAPLGNPRFSPDGNFIYYFGREGILQIPVFGGEARKIASNSWSNFSISPDGTLIAFPRGHPTENQSSIVVAATDGSGERIAATRTGPDLYVGWGPAPAFAPDGEHVAVVTAVSSREEEMRVAEIDLRNGVEREMQIGAVWEYIEYIDWPSKNEMLVAGRRTGEAKSQVWSVNLPGGAAERLTNDFNEYLSFTLSRDKSRIIAIQVVENLHLWVFDVQTGSARQITSGLSRADGRFGLAVGPDGSVYFSARDKSSYNIYSINADGGSPRQLTKDAGRRNIDVAVAPDSRLIAFSSDRTGSPHLWLMNLDGTEVRQLTGLSGENTETESSPSFSSDGKWIYYVSWDQGKGSIRKISMQGGEPVAVSRTDKNVYEPVPSPDGKFLAHAVYNDEAAGSPWQVAVTSLDDGNAPERYFNFSAFRLRVRWTLDSNSVVSIDDQSGRINLWQTNLKSGERQPITNFTTEKIYRFDVSPDQRFYALARGNYFYDAVLIER